jgi:Flp pilus assembly protein CpaB
MSSQAPRGRQASGTGRSGGGRALMLFGVLLALLSGVLVIFIVSQATSTGQQTEQLVVAVTAIPSGTVLTPTNIKTDFVVEKYPVSLVPAGAYVFTTEDALEVHLNQTVAVENIVPGDVLLGQDARFQPVGKVGNGGSITLLNPALLPSGSVLFAFNYSFPTTSTSSFISAGDKVDILVQECSAPYSKSGQCEDQTTLQNIVVYATYSSSVILVLKPIQAEQLRVLASSGTIDLAIIKPGDSSSVSSNAVTPADLASQFNY